MQVTHRVARATIMLALERASCAPYTVSFALDGPSDRSYDPAATRSGFIHHRTGGRSTLVAQGCEGERGGTHARMTRTLTQLGLTCELVVRSRKRDEFDSNALSLPEV